MTVIGVAMVIGECGNLTLIFPIRSRLPCRQGRSELLLMPIGPMHQATWQGARGDTPPYFLSPLSRGRRSFCSKSFQLADDQPAHSLFPPSRRKTTDMSVPQAAILDAGVPAAALLAVLRAR